MEKKKYLTVKETAEFLGRSERTIYRMIVKGLLPASQIQKGGSWFIDAQKLSAQLGSEVEHARSN